MCRTARVVLSLVATVSFLALLLTPTPTLNAAPPTVPADADGAAKQILDAAGLHGGLIVHLGCGDGRLTAALRTNSSFVVHGLDSDAEKVRQAQANLQQRGVYGPVAVEQFDGKRLPYAENLVNLIVAEDLGLVTKEEALRVLAPGGTLLTRKDGSWSSCVKPHPTNTDEWTHYLHDSSGNAVAHDQVVGPPRRVQWVAEPLYTRSHEHIPSIYALVSTAGRLFYIADEAPIASIRRPPQWRLVARDAYNGVLLWKQSIDKWFPHIVNWGNTPSQLERKLVAVGDRVYVTLGLHSPLSVLDAASGKVLKVYDDTMGVEEIVLHKGVLLLARRSVTNERIAQLEKFGKLLSSAKSALDDRDTADPLVKGFKSTEAKADVAVLALEAGSGRMLWKKEGDASARLKSLTLSAIDDRAFYQNGKETVCVDLRSGRELWSASQSPQRVVCDKCVVCSDDKTATALALDSGKVLWEADTSLVDVRDTFVVNGSVWLGGFRAAPGKRAPVWGPYFVTQLDLATGKTLSKIEPENPSHHHRCYLNKATDRYILGGRRGTEFIDLATGDVGWNSFARGVCKYGVMPCNGLMYTPPHACGCYITVKLAGFHALAPAEMVKRGGEGEKGRGGDGPRLERGAAYATTSNPQSRRSERSDIPNPSDWPTYRHDAMRSGHSPSPVPASLRCRWEAKIGGRITAPTLCDGKLFAASVDEHRVCVVEADSGKPLWSFTAGGRVDTPPTLHEGRAIFGCRDGAIYSLRMSDGALAWRLGPARPDRRIIANGQLESVSPLFGSVLVHDGEAHFTTGRSSYLDGGIDLCRLEPSSGKILYRTTNYSPDPETDKQPPQAAPYSMPGARADA